MISFESVHKTFVSKQEKFQALTDVTFTINQNECFGVIGESGAGKSTLLRMINALERPTEGRVIVDNNEVGTLHGASLRSFQSEIGMIFQQFNLLSNKTVKDNILLPLAIHKRKNPLDIDHVLDFVGLSSKKHAYPAELSGGQKQRVGIARALIAKPKILLCDEPTSALDLSTTNEIVSVLKRVNKEFNITIVVVTHELDVIKQLCERSALLKKGQLIDIISVNKAADIETERDYYDKAIEVLQT